MSSIPSFKRTLGLSLLLMLSGCQYLGINYSRPAVQLPEQYAEADNQAETQLQNQWWTLFQDPQLTELVEKAYTNNTNVKLAVARIEEADAQMREVGAALLPTVDLESSATRNRLTKAGNNPVFGQNPRNTFRLGLNSSVELDFWGKLSRAKEAARANYLGTQYAKETVMWSLSSLVANNYLDIRSIDSQLVLTQQNLKTSEESLALTKRRLEGGVVSVLDVHQAEIVKQNLTLQIQELERLRALSEHQLAVLTGDLNLKLTSADLMAMPVPPTPPAGLPSRLMEARPDVRQAEQQMVAANANIGIAKAALYPSISLTGALGGESADLGDVLKSAARFWTLGVSLNLPIFNSGKLNSRVDQATAQQKQALAEYQGAIETAFREVNDTLVNLRQYRSREQTSLAKQTTAKQLLEVAQNRYKAGYSAYIDVLDAQRSQNEATQAYVQSRQDTLTQTVALFKALGAGWTPLPASNEKKPAN